MKQHRFAWMRSLLTLRATCICTDIYPCPTESREEFRAELARFNAFTAAWPRGWQ